MLLIIEFSISDLLASAWSSARWTVWHTARAKEHLKLDLLTFRLDPSRFDLMALSEKVSGLDPFDLLRRALRVGPVGQKP